MTISRKLVLTMLGVAITPLCIGLYYGNQIVVRQTEQLVGTRLQDSIEQTARAIDQFMLEAKRSMHDFVDDALDHRDDLALLSKKLRARTYTHPVFNELDFVDPTGKIVASSNTRNTGRNILDGLEQVRTDFEEAKADLYSKVYVADTDDFTKRPAVTQGSQGRAPIDVPIVMIAGVRDQTGSLRGLVVGRIQFGGIRNLVTECNQRTPGIVATTLVDHDGGVLVSSNFKHKQFELVPEFSDRSFQRRSTSSSGWMMRLDSENKRVMTGYAQLQDYCADKEGGWTLLTNASYSVMMAPFGGAMANLFTAFVPMLVVVGIMGYLLSRSLSKPLLKLAETARALSSGDYSARVACGSNDETGLVAKTFNQMAEQVQRDRTSVRNEMDERLKAEEDRNRFFTLSVDLLCIVDSDGKFVRTSPSFEAVLGWSSAEVSGQSFLDFVHREDVEDSLSEFRALQLGSSTYNFENRYLTKDGGHRWISWNAVFFPGGMIYAAGRDITEQKAARVELTQAKDSAEKASRAKDEFLSHMSHELRTPLNAVIGFAQLLQIQSDDRDTLDSAESILKGGRHLLALVNEVLDLAKIESGNMTVSLEPVPLMDAVRQSMDLVKPIADE